MVVGFLKNSNIYDGGLIEHCLCWLMTHSSHFIKCLFQSKVIATRVLDCATFRRVANQLDKLNQIKCVNIYYPHESNKISKKHIDGQAI